MGFKWKEVFSSSSSVNDDGKLVKDKSGVFIPNPNTPDPVIKHDRLTIDIESGIHTHESQSYNPAQGRSYEYHGGENAADRGYYTPPRSGAPRSGDD